MSPPWMVVLDQRKRVMVHLVEARKHAVYAGDRPVVDYLDGAIRRQRDRVHYAQKMAYRGERCFTLVGARIAPPDNRPDNARPTMGN